MPPTTPPRYAAAVAALKQTGSEQIGITERIRDRMYLPLLDRSIARGVGGVDDVRTIVSWALALVVALGLAAAALVLRGALAEEHFQHDRDDERERQMRRTDLESRVQRGLEMTRTEEGTYSVVASAVGRTVPGRGAELLVADSSRAHFRQVLDLGLGTDACSVEQRRRECPATHAGVIRVFPSSNDIDACPFLRDGQSEACSAACLPVSAAGRAIGVVHVKGDDRQPPDPETVELLRLVALRAGEHIGLLRAMERSETQAHTDSLTGLLNRRSVESTAHKLMQDGTQFVVAFADLDHFKVLNDTYGHESGDRALRLFARVLRDSVRPSDVPGRFGGEEFVIVLPECSIDDAVAVAERLRRRLRDTLANPTVPPFTVSVGVADSGSENGFSETLARADEALLNAKAEGRDRVVVFSGDAPIAAMSEPIALPRPA